MKERLVRGFLPITCASTIFCGAIAAQGTTFGDPQVITTSARGASFVTAADIDGDGDMDVISTAYDDDKVTVSPNLGGGNFGTDIVLTTTADGVFKAMALDYDGDSDLDVISAAAISREVLLHENTGGGSFAPPRLLTTLSASPDSIDVADINGDNLSDLITVEARSSIRVYVNSGSSLGGFIGPQRIGATRGSLGTLFDSALALDFDGDGDLDVLASSGFSIHQFSVIENVGGGFFGGQRYISNASRPIYSHSLCPIDFNGDGITDLISSGHSSGSSWPDGLTIHTNDYASGGQFILSEIGAAGESYSHATAGDLDGDGDADILVNGPYGRFLMIANNAGSVGDTQTVWAGTSSVDRLHLSDISGDGALDLVWSSRSGNTIYWQRNLVRTYPAIVTNVGLGCGSPNLSLSSQSTPRRDSQMGVSITSVPQPACVVTLGFEGSSTPGGLGLPFDLSVFGMPGCNLYTYPLDFFPAQQGGSPGTMRLTFDIPFQGLQMLGQHFYVQAFCFSPGANAAGVITSNALDCLIGNR